MRMPNLNDKLTITRNYYIDNDTKLNVLSGCEIIVKEKTDDYIILFCSVGLAEISDSDTISLFDAPKEVRINKGETKHLTLPVTDYFESVYIKY